MLTRRAERENNSSRRILAVLHRNRGRHLSAQEVYVQINRLGPRVHLATVYRSLQRLSIQGRVKRSSLSQNHAHYELAENAGVHLLCESCGRLLEVRMAPVERAMAALNRRLGHSFQAKNWQLQVVGVCRECRRT